MFTDIKEKKLSKSRSEEHFSEEGKEALMKFLEKTGQLKNPSRFFKAMGSVYRLEENSAGVFNVFKLKDDKETFLPDANGLEIELEGEEIPIPASDGLEIELEGEEIPDPRDRTAY